MHCDGLGEFLLIGLGTLNLTFYLNNVYMLMNFVCIIMLCAYDVFILSMIELSLLLLLIYVSLIVCMYLLSIILILPLICYLSRILFEALIIFIFDLFLIE